MKYQYIEYQRTFFIRDRICQVFYVDFNVTDMPTYLDNIFKKYS